MEVSLGSGGVPISSRDPSTIGGIQTIKDIGLQAMEVEFVRGVTMGNATARKAGELARKLGIRLSVHAPYYINLCNPDKREASMKRILDSCERAHHLGAKVVAFHPGYHGGENEKCLKMVVEACQEMAEHVREKDWKVKLGPETTGKVSQICDIDETIRLCRKVSGCVPVVDWAHIYAKNQGKIDFREILDSLKPLKLSDIHSHFSCINYGPKGELNHLPLSEKKPDYMPLVKELIKRNQSITMISESPLLEKDALKMKKMFQDAGYKF
jgi:deoxyribonuclease-4